MDRSGVNSKGVIVLLIMASLILSGFVFLAQLPTGEASKSGETDEFGYYWVDNKDPDPKVDYQWINAKGVGTALDITDSGSYDTIVLTWEFPLYGQMYDTLYVGSQNVLWFEDIGAAPYYYDQIPNSNDPNPLIGVGWGYGYNSIYSFGGVHYITGQDNIGKWICIEWNTNNYGLTSELILWDSGLIKMQFSDVISEYSTSYSYGQYHTVGIENQDASDFLLYSGYNDANLINKLAVEISTGTANVDLYQMENGGGMYNKTAFAEYDHYEYSFEVYDSAGQGDLTDVRIYFGAPSLNIWIKYDIGGGLGIWSIGGGSQYLDLDVNLSRTSTLALENGTGISVHFFVKFMFNIPIDGNTSMTLWARGKTALPTIYYIDDAFYLDSVIKLLGESTILNEKGVRLFDEGFSREDENITFGGKMVSYNTTKIVYPPNSAYFYRMIDDEFIEYFDYNASGRNMSIIYKMPHVALKKTFSFSLKYGDGSPFPAGKLIGEFPSYTIKVDDSSPIATASLVIRADSFKDSEREVDNDNVVYISWSSIMDSGSGVALYRIWTTYAPGDDNIPSVSSKETEFKWNGTDEGIFKIFVWAEDAVGHPGDWSEASIKIDRKDPFFTDFYPSMSEVPWLKTLTPALTIQAKDNLTISDGISGVDPTSIEYSISTEGVDNFEEWISADLHDDDSIKEVDTINVKLSPRFVEGTENFIRYRLKDKAGNGYSYSDVYNLQIDVTPVAFEEFFPTVNVWHDVDIISEKEVECYIVDDTSGIRTNQIYYRVSDGYDADIEQYSWVTGVPQQNGWEKLSARNWDRIEGDNLVYIHFIYPDFQEGDQNFIQFMVRDEAGNGEILPYTGFSDLMTPSPLYQIKVNTQPIPVIKTPVMLQEFYITDLITFDGSDSYDIDVDEGNLKFEWFVHEMNKTIGFEPVVENFRFPAAGKYNVTLYVADSVHRLDPVTGEDKRSSERILLTVIIYIPPIGIDSDEDGIDDDWEYYNLLDMNLKDSDEDADRDGYTNLEEYNANTDPWDPTSKPVTEINNAEPPVKEAPFEIWLFMAILFAAIIVAAVIVLIGYLRVHRQEQQEMTEEAEEEAMLATPQLDIPTLSSQIPMVDPSIPTLPAPQEMPFEEQPLPVETPMSQEVPVDMVPQPMDAAPMPEPMPVQDNPLYQEQTAQGENPLYDGQ